MFACVRVRVCDGVFACVRVQDDSCGGQNLLRFRVVFQGIAFSGRCPPAMLTCQHNAMGGFHNRGETHRAQCQIVFGSGGRTISN